MTEAIFGLIGVVVGGLLQSGAQWHMERRREDWAARKAGRLLARSLGRCKFILDASTTVDMSWGFVARELEETLATWDRHADTLAGTIGQSDWNEISHTMDGLARIRQRALVSDTMSDEDRAFLADYAEQVWVAAFASSLIGTVGIRATPRMLLRRAWSRLRREDHDEQAQKLVDDSFEVEGREPPARD